MTCVFFYTFTYLGKGNARNRLLFSCISYFRNEYEQERSGTEARNLIQVSTVSLF